MLALKVMHRVVLSSRLRRTVAALAVFALMLLSGSALASTYYNVNGEMGGVMKFDPPNPGAAFDDVLNRWTFTVGVRNTARQRKRTCIMSSSFCGTTHPSRSTPSRGTT